MAGYENLAGFRPGPDMISGATLVVCKVMELLVRDRLVMSLQSKFSCYQHGFVKQRSCLTNLLESLEAWTSALDDGYRVDVIYLDYRKAFDSMSHSRLLDKLRGYGIHGRWLNWIVEFLRSRKMRVRVRNDFSDWMDVLSGVPHGSVLGPLLFLIFVNDRPQWIKNQIRLFADDTEIWRKFTSLEDKLLDELLEWSDTWKLNFNPDKCYVMHIGHSLDTEYYMSVGGVNCLAVMEQEKDLGITVTKDLKPSFAV